MNTCSSVCSCVCGQLWAFPGFACFAVMGGNLMWVTWWSRALGAVLLINYSMRSWHTGGMLYTSLFLDSKGFGVGGVPCTFMRPLAYMGQHPLRTFPQLGARGILPNLVYVLLCLAHVFSQTRLCSVHQELKAS